MQCADKNCPTHGTLRVRGKILEGRVISAKSAKTVIVERDYLHHVPKYERYERRTSRVAAHNPPCLAAGEGDFVRVGECRKLSRTKAFVVLQVVKKEAEK